MTSRFCPTCSSAKHVECCRRCGRPVLARRRGTGFCKLACAQAQAAEDATSAAQEAAVTARVTAHAETRVEARKAEVDVRALLDRRFTLTVQYMPKQVTITVGDVVEDPDLLVDASDKEIFRAIRETVAMRLEQEMGPGWTTNADQQLAYAVRAALRAQEGADDE